MPGPDAPDPLLAALARHAAAAPEQPWLFAPRAGDWVWWSWADGLRRVSAMRETMAAAGLEGGAAMARLDVPRPETICLALALQGADFPSPYLSPFADSLTAANRLAAALPADRPLGRSGREVFVFGGRLGDPDDRAVLSWALLAGAAVLLEPEPAAVVPTAVWARVTLFHGDAGRLGALRNAVERERESLFTRLARRFGRPTPVPRPLGRLHTLVLTGAAPLPQSDLAFWQTHRVTVVHLADAAAR